MSRLSESVIEHLTVPHQFVCLTDQVFYLPGVEIIPLKTDWPGWFAKIELFRLTGKTLYFDLDTVITGNLDDIASYPHRFTMLSDFFTGKPASGVMAWEGDYTPLCHEFNQGRWKGDQDYIGRKVDCEFFQNLFPGQIVSRKVSETRNPDERVVCFHGKPRPHTVGWRV